MKPITPFLLFVLIFFSSLLMAHSDSSFYTNQLLFPRVKEALDRRLPWIDKEKKKLGLNADQATLFFRVFKKEKELEVWIKKEDNYVLFQLYPICYFSGGLGPKRKEGDMQVPEGLYHIAVFNPESKFHLSLGLNYPNESDRILSDPIKPGSNIYIHGDCVSTGCLAMTDDLMEEIYILSLLAARVGQSQMPVHIFPFRFAKKGIVKKAISKRLYKHLPLWNSLLPVYRFFEEKKKIPLFTIDEKGMYHLLK